MSAHISANIHPDPETNEMPVSISRHKPEPGLHTFWTVDFGGAGAKVSVFIRSLDNLAAIGKEITDYVASQVVKP